MPLTDDYKLVQQLYEGSESIVFRAVEKKSSTLVVLKYYKQSEKQNAVLRNKMLKQYEIGKLFTNNSYGLNYIELKEYEDMAVLIMEDFGGVMLAQILATVRTSSCFSKCEGTTVF